MSKLTASKSVVQRQNAIPVAPLSPLTALDRAQWSLIAVERLFREIDPPAPHNGAFREVRIEALCEVKRIERDRQILAQEGPSTTRQEAIEGALRGAGRFAVCAATSKMFRKLRAVDQGSLYQLTMTRAFSQVAQAAEKRARSNTPPAKPLLIESRSRQRRRLA